MHFIHYVGDGVHKIDHDIFSHNWLKLNNVMYELTGIVVHEGASINSGHYYSITRCWDNGDAFKLNDLRKKRVTKLSVGYRKRESLYVSFQQKTQ